MEEKELRLETADGPMRTFVAHPDGDGPFPVAILFMDAVGYREQLKENARRFAADGYWVAVPDLWHHFGEDVQIDFNAIAAAGFKGPELERMFGLVAQLTPELVQGDVESIVAAAAEDATASEKAKVCVGYCMGARFSLNTAATRPDEFVAAAAIHPGPLLHDGTDSPHHDLDTVKGTLYFGFADRDEHAPLEMRDALRLEMEKRGIAGTVETMPGSFHGFAMADLPAYQQEAAERHFERTLVTWRQALDVLPTDVVNAADRGSVSE